METRLLLRNGEQLLLAVVIPLIVLVGGILAAKRFDLPTSHRPGRPAHPRRARAGGDVDQLHLAGDRHRLRAAVRRAQAARLLPAPPVGPAGRQGRWRCCSSRSSRSSCWAAPASPSAGTPTSPAAGVLGAAGHRARRHGRLRLPGPAHRRRAARRGHAGRRQPRLPAADGGRRGRAPGLVVRRRRGDRCPRCPAPRSGPGCAPRSSTAAFPLGPVLVLAVWAAVGTVLTARTFTWE